MHQSIPSLPIPPFPKPQVLEWYLTFSSQGITNVPWCSSIGHFWVVFHPFQSESGSAKPFIWKVVLFTCKWTRICMWIKLISIWKASHYNSLWNRGKRQFGNHLMGKSPMVDHCTEEIHFLVNKIFRCWQMPPLELPSCQMPHIYLYRGWGWGP